MRRGAPRIPFWAALCLALAAAPGPGGAEGWKGFYTPTERPAPPIPATLGPAALGPATLGPAALSSAAPVPGGPAAADACTGAILAAQVRYAIPGNLLLAIGLQEAGMRRQGRVTVWPWSVNAAGDGRMFATEAEALDWVRRQQAAGVASIDVGCMQVNLRWHPDAFASLEAAFDPGLNVDYAARFLLDLYRRTGDWTLAAGSYHSQNDTERQTYLAALRTNLAVADTLAAGAPPLPGPALAGPPLPGPAQPAQKLELADALPMPAIGWSASLSAARDSRRISIYSRHDLQPVLPKFTQEF